MKIAICLALFTVPLTTFAQDRSPTADPDATAVLTESVGLFASLQLYNTYLNIGILADAMAAELYPPGDVNQLLGSVVVPLERVEKQLDKISLLKLSKEDLEAVARMKEVAGLLRLQGKELDLFWGKGQSQNGKNYEAARQAAWKELNLLLELEPKEEKLSTPPRPK